MAHFQAAIRAGREPLCSVTDNLYLMALMEAGHRSHETGLVVALPDVMGDRYDPAYGPGWRHGYREWTPPSSIADVSLIRGEAGYAWN
jgi:hypothetical protein